MPLFSLLFPQLWIPDSDGRPVALLPGPRLLGRIVVLPNRYFTHARRKVPRGDQKGRRAALAQAAFESRYRDPDFLVTVRASGPRPTEASIWSWDKTAVETLTGTSRARVIPEPLARLPMSNGARIVEASEGYDGEVWLNETCIASRWWAQRPDLADWNQFIAGARSRDWPVNEDGSPLSYSMPQPEPAVWNKNIFWVRRDLTDRLQSIGPLQLAMTVLALAAVPAGCEATQYARLIQERSSIEAALTKQRIAAEPWLNLRRQALADQRLVSDMSAPGDPVSLVFALMDLDSALVSVTSPIERIEYLDGELRITLKDSEAQNVVSMVSGLEQSASWTSVRYDPATRQIVGKVETGARPAKVAAP